MSKKVTIKELSENTEEILTECLTMGDAIKVPVNKSGVVIIPEGEWIFLTNAMREILNNREERINKRKSQD